MIKKLFLLLLFVNPVFGGEVVWKGVVKSNGAPTEAIPLVLKESYQIKCSGFINLGKWIQAGKKLGSDACFEFSDEAAMDKIDCLKNSQEISVCKGSYNPSHVYESEPFVASQNRIHFWVYDTDYDDNSGEFQVEIIRVAK